MLKEHLLTLFLTVTTIATLLIFSHLNQPRDTTVFDINDVLFEHQTTVGHLMITSNPYNELSLTFFNRHIDRLSYVDSASVNDDHETSHLLLASSLDVPFTTHAVISRNPDLHEILVMESGSPIAHHAHAKKTACDLTAVFMVASSDLTGEDFFVIGLNAEGEVILEIDTP